MSKPYRYLELCDVAQCSPDSPHTHVPNDKSGQARWLSARLQRHGHNVSPGECRNAADDFYDEINSGKTRWTWRIKL